jgi:hypothetical protein
MYLPVSLRQRRNPATANERKKTKNAIPTAASPKLEPCKDNVNRSGHKIATNSPPKPPDTTPTQIESKFRDNLLIRNFSPFIATNATKDTIMAPVWRNSDDQVD